MWLIYTKPLVNMWGSPLSSMEFSWHHPDLITSALPGSYPMKGHRKMLLSEMARQDARQVPGRVSCCPSQDLRHSLFLLPRVQPSLWETASNAPANILFPGLGLAQPGPRGCCFSPVVALLITWLTHRRQQAGPGQRRRGGARSQPGAQSQG